MKKAILQILSGIAMIVFLLSCCCLDSETLAPAIALVISGAWLTLIYMANRKRR